MPSRTARSTSTTSTANSPVTPAGWALLVVSGASNVTGVVPPIHDLAERVHAAGGRIVVDAAQLAPHRPIDMRSHRDPGHLDFVALSAHKLYAPFGSGALIGSRAGFAGAPDHSGGGTVDAVTLAGVHWTGLPHREEAGTPNLLGAVAFAAAVSRLDELGWDRIVAHERTLLRQTLDGLAAIPGVRVHGPRDADATIGVVPFTVEGVDHGLVAAVLGYEHGIAVRSGCFCAHPYVAHLLGLDAAAAERWATRVGAGDRHDAPGMVRASLGFYNDSPRRRPVPGGRRPDRRRRHRRDLRGRRARRAPPAPAPQRAGRGGLNDGRPARSGHSASRSAIWSPTFSISRTTVTRSGPSTVDAMAKRSGVVLLFPGAGANA